MTAHLWLIDRTECAIELSQKGEPLIATRVRNRLLGLIELLWRSGAPRRRRRGDGRIGGAQLQAMPVGSLQMLSTA